MNNRLEMGTRGYPRDEERCIRVTFVTQDAFARSNFQEFEKEKRNQDGLEKSNENNSEGSFCLPLK